MILHLLTVLISIIWQSPAVCHGILHKLSESKSDLQDPVQRITDYFLSFYCRPAKSSLIKDSKQDSKYNDQKKSQKICMYKAERYRRITHDQGSCRADQRPVKAVYTPAESAERNSSPGAE